MSRNDYRGYDPCDCEALVHIVELYKSKSQVYDSRPPDLRFESFNDVFLFFFALKTQSLRSFPNRDVRYVGALHATGLPIKDLPEFIHPRHCK